MSCFYCQRELSVDYMYLVMPKMLKAAAHLLNPLIKFDADGTAHHVTAKAIAGATQATWVLITNLSNINKLVTLPGYQLFFTFHCYSHCNCYYYHYCPHNYYRWMRSMFMKPKRFVKIKTFLSTLVKGMYTD